MAIFLTCGRVKSFEVSFALGQTSEVFKIKDDDEWGRSTNTGGHSAKNRKNFQVISINVKR